jgi:signal transduction histidine kinase
LERARQATARAEEELWNSRLNEARARRVAGGPGARMEAAAIISELVERPNLDGHQIQALRQEAIAQLALVDVTPGTNEIVRTNFVAWDSSLTRYLRHNAANEVEVREYPSGRVIVSLRGASNAVPQFSVFTPDGKFVATRFHGSDVLVWEWASRNLLLKSRCHRMPNDYRPLMPSPDSRQLMMFTITGLVVQPLIPNGATRALQPGRVVYNALFTTDMKRLAVIVKGAQSVVEIWDATTGATLQRFDVGFAVWTFEWHPDGRRLAISGDRGRLGLWDVASLPASALSSDTPAEAGTNASGEMLRFEGHTGAVDYTGFSPDGSYLLTHAYDKTSILWDVTSGQRLFAETRVRLENFSANGENILGVASHDITEAVSTFRRRTGFRNIAWIGERQQANGVWLSPDSKLLVIAHPADASKRQGQCRIWDLTRGLEVARLPGIWAQISPDGRALYTFAVETLRRYQLKPELLTGEAEWPEGEVVATAQRGDSINAGTISADGRTMVVGAVGRVMLVDLPTKSVRKQFNVYTHNAQLSPDGTLLATRFHNQFGTLRNPTNGAVLTQMVGVVEFVFSPDNKWILAKSIDKLRLLDRSLAVVREVPLEVGAGFPPSTAFNHDSTLLAVVHNRFDVRLVELATGRELATLASPRPAQAMWSQGLVFSHDGQRLVLAKENGEVIAWDLPIVRKELAAMGLDWNTDGTTRPERSVAVAKGMATRTRASAASDPQPTSTLAPLPATGNPALSTAFVAVALALAAGLFVSLHQRRMLSAYVRAEALTAEQQRKLQTAQEELQHSQKMRALGTLAAGVAHDFNNLLSVIRLSNQLASEQTQAKGAAKENMDAIESAVGQGEVIVQSMLGYSRAGAEGENEYSVAAAISETVAMLGKKFLSGIVLQLEVQPDIPMVRSVRGRLEQMLLNLVVNASEAMNGSGTLRLSAWIVLSPGECLLKPNAAPRYVAVSVGDSGPGIPADVLPRVFEPFFTTKNAGARPGTGLGLSTVYTMAQQDGLGLAVETSARSGTVFCILVPIMNEPRPLERPAATERKKPSATLVTGA